MELYMLAKCSHITGVIRLIDWYCMPQGFLIVMERPQPCIDLFDFIRSQNRLTEELSRYVFRQIVKTIVACAKIGVLHRDIKDENVIIDLVDGRTHLIDFGAATLLKNTNYTDFQGTRLYCPPEWFLHSLYLGEEAAVWSLGVLLYNMLNGRLPFRSEKDICTSHLIGPLPFYTPVSDAAKNMIECCLQFNPFERCRLNDLMNHEWLKEKTFNWFEITTSGTEINASEDETKAKEEAIDHCSGERPTNVRNVSDSDCESGVGSTSDVSSVCSTSSQSHSTNLHVDDESNAKRSDQRCERFEIPLRQQAKISLIESSTCTINNANPQFATDNNGIIFQKFCLAKTKSVDCTNANRVVNHSVGPTTLTTNQTMTQDSGHNSNTLPSSDRSDQLGLHIAVYC
ncbi:hypothetical protein AB6A40_001317 [Gnathostoma spinigerum]|uniref:non-specific serine/threonine protein kinase n=1 Tax=Gnathostoma spinigerum TaxID=75299 RepID=A0ABD6ECQ8_9BILA